MYSHGLLLAAANILISLNTQGCSSEVVSVATPTTTSSPSPSTPAISSDCPFTCGLDCGSEPGVCMRSNDLSAKANNAELTTGMFCSTGFCQGCRCNVTTPKEYDAASSVFDCNQCGDYCGDGVYFAETPITCSNMKDGIGYCSEKRQAACTRCSCAGSDPDGQDCNRCGINCGGAAQECVQSTSTTSDGAAGVPEFAKFATNQVCSSEGYCKGCRCSLTELDTTLADEPSSDLSTRSTTSSQVTSGRLLQPTFVCSVVEDCVSLFGGDANMWRCFKPNGDGGTCQKMCTVGSCNAGQTCLPLKGEESFLSCQDFHCAHCDAYCRINSEVSNLWTSSPSLCKESLTSLGAFESGGRCSGAHTTDTTACDSCRCLYAEKNEDPSPIVKDPFQNCNHCQKNCGHPSGNTFSHEDFPEIPEIEATDDLCMKSSPEVEAFVKKNSFPICADCPENMSTLQFCYKGVCAGCKCGRVDPLPYDPAKVEALTDCNKCLHNCGQTHELEMSAPEDIADSVFEMTLEELREEMMNHNFEKADEIKAANITSFCLEHHSNFGAADFLLMTEGHSRCVQGPCAKCRCTRPFYYMDRRTAPTSTATTTLPTTPQSASSGLPIEEWNDCHKQLFIECHERQRQSEERCISLVNAGQHCTTSPPEDEIRSEITITI